jgi:hypothetical protein
MYLISEPGRAAPSAKWRLVYSGTDGRVFENTHAWPRVFTLDPSSGAPAAGNLSVTDYREMANAIRFTAQVPGAAPVLAETSIVSDGGWHARLDPGTSIPVGKTGGPFLSILLPPGTHRVHLDYRPPGFAAGLTLSAAAALLLSAAGYARWRKQQQRKASVRSP